MRTYSANFIRFFSCTIIIAMSLFAWNASAQSCDALSAAVETSCVTTPSTTKLSNSDLGSSADDGNLCLRHQDTIKNANAASAKTTEMSSSCRSAGTSCSTGCEAEAVKQDTIANQTCGEDDSECKNAKDEAKKEAARLRAVAAACASKSATQSSAMDNAVTAFNSEAAGAEAIYKKSCGNVLPPKPIVPRKPAPPAGGGGGGGGGGGSDKDRPYTERECAQKDDAYKHVSCTKFAIKNCKSRLTDARCVKFTDHYCIKPTPTGDEGSVTVNGGATQTRNGEQDPRIREEGEGFDSGYCQFVRSKKFCDADPTRTGCPSCGSLVRLASAACDSDANSVDCLPQMDEATKDEARNSCPNDPLFANPAFNIAAEDDGSSTITSGANTVVGGDIAPAAYKSNTAPTLFNPKNFLKSDVSPNSTKTPRTYKKKN
jgi:hypothetical protein